MENNSFQYPKLQQDIGNLIGLFSKELSLRNQHDLTVVQESLRKVISPTFEIVFSGAFSAGKSMLINALLGRKLLYSSEGHATGTECRIAYAEPGQEKVVLTFLSEAEIVDQVNVGSSRLGIKLTSPNFDNATREFVRQNCQKIIDEERGEHRSEKAKQANALSLLVQGYEKNREFINSRDNAIYSMDKFNFSTLQEAANYARRGSNSAVLKRIEYFCCDPLLKDGNILIDTPGIDAPVRQDAELTYKKIKHPDTSAIVCVLKTAETGELTAEETELLETIQNNPGIRDRVFYIFNRVDKTWYNPQLRKRLENCIKTQFRDSSRVFQTSGLLGFYSRLIQETSAVDRFGLDSIFIEESQGLNDTEETPLFVTEFNNYCGNSGKLFDSPFKLEIRGYESPNQNYVRVLSEHGQPLIQKMIKDSGLDVFRDSIINYLIHEKRPQLISTLINDLYPICTTLRDFYLHQHQILVQQPQTAEEIKSQKIKQLAADLKNVGDRFESAIEDEINEIAASNYNEEFERDFLKLKAQMVTRLDELIHTFSVETVYQKAQASHRRNSVVPLLGILAEAFYYLANGLEEVLVNSSQDLVQRYFQRFINQVRDADYYRDIYHLLGNDAGIEERLNQAQKLICEAIVNEAHTECDRYVRERPEFYKEGSPSIWQLCQTLQQACQGYDYHTMIDAEPAIRQLLKLDFEQKVRETVLRTYRQTINQTLNIHLLKIADEQRTAILQKYDYAREYLAQTLEKEAVKKAEVNQMRRRELEKNMIDFNSAINRVNGFLESIQLDRDKLPSISQRDLEIVPIES